jgi:hypothetical protein
MFVHVTNTQVPTGVGGVKEVANRRFTKLLVTYLLLVILLRHNHCTDIHFTGSVHEISAFVFHRDIRLTFSAERYRETWADSLLTTLRGS